MTTHTDTTSSPGAEPEVLRGRLDLAPGAFAVVVSGPSGVGKSTICQALQERDPGVRTCVTTTTRPMRPGEVDGEHYHFTTADGFRELLETGRMVEWAEVHGHRYGATVDAVQKAMGRGHVMLLDIDVQGADTWKDVLGKRCVRVFILPPSMEELSRRLAGRRTEARESFELRMKTARRELARAGDYDYALVNRDLDGVVADLSAILTAERSRPQRVRQILQDLNEQTDQ